MNLSKLKKELEVHLKSHQCFLFFPMLSPWFSIIFHPGSRTPPASPPPALPPWFHRPRKVSPRHQPLPLRVRWVARRPVRCQRCPVWRGRKDFLFFFLMMFLIIFDDFLYVLMIFWIKLRKSKRTLGILKEAGELKDR